VNLGLINSGPCNNIGNREWSKTNGTELTYLANQLNQYTQIANGVTNNLTYDLDGNLLTDGKWTNTWDGENRLIGVTPLSVTNGAKKLLSRYDYMGRRVRKDVLQWNGSLWQTNEVRTFSYDGWNMVAELSDAGAQNTTNFYVFGLDLSGSLQGAGGIGGLLSATFGGTNGATAVFYTYCANGNVSELVDATGTNVLAHYEYSPFGEAIVATGPLADVNAIRFSTKYWDIETGLGYWGYRWLQDGRWLNRDPIEEMGGLNVYALVHNDSINLLDLIGLLSKDIEGSMIKKYRDEATLDIKPVNKVGGGTAATWSLLIVFEVKMTVSYLDCCKTIDMVKTTCKKQNTFSPGGTDYGIIRPDQPMQPLPAPGTMPSFLNVILQGLRRIAGGYPDKVLPDMKTWAGLIIDEWAAEQVAKIIDGMTDWKAWPTDESYCSPGLKFVPCK